MVLAAIYNEGDALNLHTIALEAERAGWTVDSFLIERNDGADSPVLLLSKFIEGSEQEVKNEVEDLSKTGPPDFDPAANRIVPNAELMKQLGTTAANLALFTGNHIMGDLPAGLNDIFTTILHGPESRDDQDEADPAVQVDTNADDADKGDEDAAEPDEAGANVQPPPPVDKPALEAIHQHLFDNLTTRDKHEIAAGYFRTIIHDELTESGADYWSKAPELYLLNQLHTDDAQYQEIVKQMLLLKAGLKSTQVRLDEAELTSVNNRNLMVAEAVNVAKEAIKGMKRWRKLAWPALLIMGAALIFSGYIIYLIFNDASLQGLDSYVVPIVIFVLAVFSASPAVILLLQRPLKGVDEFMPGGKAGNGEQGDGEGDGAGAAAEAKKKAEEAKKKAAAAADK